jgi:hypothetical protein
MGSVPVAYVYSAPDYVQFGFFRGSGRSGSSKAKASTCGISRCEKPPTSTRTH